MCDAGRMWLICGGPTRCVQPAYTLEIFLSANQKHLTLSSPVTIHCHCHACMHARHKWAQPPGSWSNGCVRWVQFSRAISQSTASRQNSKNKAGAGRYVLGSAPLHFVQYACNLTAVVGYRVRCCLASPTPHLALTWPVCVWSVALHHGGPVWG